MDLRHHTVLAVISHCYSVPQGRFPRVTHPCATRPEGLVRLACVRHAASVRSEPESNSHVYDRQTRQGKTRRTSRHLWEPFLHNIQMVCMHIGTVNDLALTEYPTPRGRQNPEPPPTCPFIYTNNENEPHRRQFLPLFQGGWDRLRCYGKPRCTDWRSAVDEGVSMRGRPIRQPLFALLLRLPSKAPETAGFLTDIWH